MSPALDIIQKTLYAMPSTLNYNRLPTDLVALRSHCRRTSCSSDNSTQISLFADHNTTTTQSSYDPAQTDFNYNITNCCSIVDEATPPYATTRQTPDVSSVDCTALETSSSTKQAHTIDSNHCHTIIQELQTPLYDILVSNSGLSTICDLITFSDFQRRFICRV